ncbi:MAG: hypothetical protein MUE73_04020 [Planctomycetes bacterium]|jgi:hypothetical protein|nr:hypothetical protein [Planctomycetota bacterium]
MSDEEFEARKAAIRETLECPHCGAKLTAHDVSDVPLGGWKSGVVFVCLNDDCPYHRDSAKTLAAQGITGGYRLVWDPDTGWCGPVAARAGIHPRG